MWGWGGYAWFGRCWPIGGARGHFCRPPWLTGFSRCASREVVQLIRRNSTKLREKSEGAQKGLFVFASAGIYGERPKKFLVTRHIQLLATRPDLWLYSDPEINLNSQRKQKRNPARKSNFPAIRVSEYNLSLNRAVDRKAIKFTSLTSRFSPFT